MKKGKVIRVALVTLPLGLLTLGLVSVFVTHLSPDSLHSSKDEHLDARMETALIKQKPVNEADLKQYVTTIADRIGERNTAKPDSLKKAAFWIESTLGPANTGYLVKRQSFEADGQTVWNLIAELPGNSRKDEVIVVGAHYDSFPGSRGANDNGSGIAALIALARAFSGEQQARTIQFVAFVNSEPPYSQTQMMGSLVFATEARHTNTEIIAAINIDSLGCFSDFEGSQKSPPFLEEPFPSIGNFIAFTGDADSKQKLESAQAAFFRASTIPSLTRVIPEESSGTPVSDDWSFWQNDYRAITVSDTAQFRDPNHHLPGDTPEVIDYEKLESSVLGLKNVIAEWANP